MTQFHSWPSESLLLQLKHLATLSELSHHSTSLDNIPGPLNTAHFTTLPEQKKSRRKQVSAFLYVQQVPIMFQMPSASSCAFRRTEKSPHDLGSCLMNGWQRHVVGHMYCRPKPMRDRNGGQDTQEFPSID